MTKRRIQKVKQTRRWEPRFFRTVDSCHVSGLEGRSARFERGEQERRGGWWWDLSRGGGKKSWGEKEWR